MTAGVFVRIDADYRKISHPELGNIDEGPRLDPAEHGFRNPDIGHVNLPAMETARQQKVADLAAKERYGFVGFDGRSLDGSTRSIDSARQIDRMDFRPRSIHGFDQRAPRTFDRPVETGAEQRIDQNTGSADGRRACSIERTRPTAGRARSFCR